MVIHPLIRWLSQETLFGRTVTPAERLRQHQRALAKAQRELDRERTKLEQQEKKLIMDIKKSAKSGQMVRKPISRAAFRDSFSRIECV